MRKLAAAVVALTAASPLSGCVRHAVAPDPTGLSREEPPPGMVEVTAVSADDAQVWDVYAGDQLVCATPCTQWVGVRSALTFASPGGEQLRTRTLGPEALQARRAVVVAESTSMGKRVNGIVFTTLGGMGVITAITLAAAGCSDMEERGGLCTAGLITGGVSVPLTAAAIWMLVDSGAKLHILPVYRSKAAAGQTPVEVAVTPAGVAGTF